MNSISEELSDYEKLRLQRIEENRKCLQELGLASNVPFSHSPYRAQSSSSTPKPAKKRRQSSASPFVPVRRIVTRRSVQLGEQYPEEYALNDDDDEDYEGVASSKKKREYRGNFFGAVEGVPVGTSWEYRIDCSAAGIHRPTVAGIHGGPEGAYSVALSGGYADDVDYGDHFTYTGSGGRDLKGTKTNPKNLRTAPQSKDQTADGYNAALIASVETQNPVRVIRGYKLSSLYAPESGYRYDGLYTVDKYWTEKGLSGFLVYKFCLSRIKGQDPPVWELEANQENYKEHSNCQSMHITNGTATENSKVGSPSKNLSQRSPKYVSPNKFNRSGDLKSSNSTDPSDKASPFTIRERNISTLNTGASPTRENGETIIKTATSPTKQGDVIVKPSITPSKSGDILNKSSNTPSKNGEVLVQCTSPSSENGLSLSTSESPKKKMVIVGFKKPSPDNSPKNNCVVLNTNGSSVAGSTSQNNLPNGGTSESKSAQKKSSPVIIYRSILPPGMKSPLMNGLAMQNNIKGVKSSQQCISPPSKTESPKKVSSPKVSSPKVSSPKVSRQSNLDIRCKVLSQPEVNASKLVSSPAKTESPKKVFSPKNTQQSNCAVKSKVSSQPEVDASKLVSPAKTDSPKKVLSPKTRQSNPEVKASTLASSPSKKNAMDESAKSFKKTSVEKRKTSDKSPTVSQTTPVSASKVTLRRDLFSRNCNSVNVSLSESSLKRNSQSPRTESDSRVSKNVTVKNNLKSPNSSFEFLKINNGAVKRSPQSSVPSESSSSSTKSPQTSDRKRSKPSNTLERYFIKKFASNDVSRAYRNDSSRVTNTDADCDSDDGSIPAFIGFNEITINNSRNRLKLLTDFVPSIVKKQQSFRSKLNQAKKFKKTDEIAKCSSSKQREFVTSVTKIRDLSAKISNMSKFHPNAGFIPECFVNCSKVDSNDSSDEEDSSPDGETFGRKNIISSESSSGFSDSPLPIKGLSPQKLLDLISSDEENDTEPFLGFQDVSTRSIIRNAFLVHKYARIIDKN